MALFYAKKMIQNKSFGEKSEVASTEDKTREDQFRWFGHCGEDQYTCHSGLIRS